MDKDVEKIKEQQAELDQMVVDVFKSLDETFPKHPKEVRKIKGLMGEIEKILVYLIEEENKNYVEGEEV